MDRIKLIYNFDHSCFYDEENKIRFEPPVYEQRYLTVLRLLELDFWKDSFKKIVEFGCAEMKFFTLLKTLPTLEKLLQIDIDEELLNKWAHSVRPLMADFIQRRANPFSVEIWRGSISAPHECLRDTDAVVGIEIIEHLFPLVLEGVPENVFGFIRPKVAIFSTPNSEYNIMFDGLLENGFRHEDHKFEWTRAQFQEWCEHVCNRYPDYVVKYFGIGPPPKSAADIGYVSQLCIFIRKDFLEKVNSEADNSEATEPQAGPSSTVPISTNDQTEKSVEPNIYFNEDIGAIVVAREEGEVEPLATHDYREPLIFHDDPDEMEPPELDLEGSDHDEPNARVIDFYLPHERARNDSGNYDDEPLDALSDEYKLLCTIDYPVQEPDKRTRSQRLLDEAEYQIRRLKYDETYYNYDENAYQIPLQMIIECMNQLSTSIEEMNPILAEASYRISEDNIVTLNGDDDSLVGSEEDFEYDMREDDDVDADQEPAGVQEPANEGASFQEDRDMWD
ncbi:small RNA 2'-O-methyltransferase [Uranotaenia lowii]|uniref:small RNA 2'-O-methyltransferase n=1 Tax=Uranotaenia lowii TaxID=190385 RepID=UPI0024789E11|nr:small RNA 2'-O-methyltransferase [Uranotaenia lowii]